MHAMGDSKDGVPTIYHAVLLRLFQTACTAHQDIYLSSWTSLY